MYQKKIVFCGGHHNSALVVAEGLREKGHQVFWFGHKYSMIGDENPSAEYLEVTQKGFPFTEIKAGKFQPRYQFWSNLLRIPLGFWQSFVGLKKIKPDLIFSFGGYLALPVAYSGWLLGIPVVTHEQTTVSGWANKMIAKIAKKVFITYPSSSKYFPQEKVVVTGLPIRREILKKGKKLFQNAKKTIYITGGKQGAHVINEAVFAILPQLLERFNVIHQCGSTTLFNDIKKAREIKENLGDKGEDYLVKEYFFEDEIGSVFRTADFIISRAGAHTVYELLALKKPAILIPIPWASGNEQEENAKVLVAAGLGIILPQKDLEAGKLWETILEFEKNLSSKKVSPASPKIEVDATARILFEVEELM
ncbi:MAG TPA: UDP-N-acetylglucosamine--N-acetylmuramyl-(pentapeptide) pyrophosphoryl-undecaprenol N-acetylglucosamine transferase [Patescibacteria group bacterium]|nr:UDP-N-acetylglucosamine--N-acetylmuramyl-(pentapeptide) pyrophosphoryl-undecaprenol N-acetylglucosamine transferase [Patescibacteria group bacterium]